jgi:TolA-binding protein
VIRRWGLFLGLTVSALALGSAGCPSSERAAQERFELARFEEQQGNAAHALQIYQEIVAKHPDTSWAEQARRRVSDLQPAQP